MPSANKTENLQLNQWTGNEYIKRDDFVQDNKKIDDAYGNLKKQVENIELVDTKVKITDTNEHFTGETLDKVLDELYVKVDGIETTAEGTSYNDETTQLGAINVQQAIEKTVEKVNDANTEITDIKSEITNIKSTPVEYTILQSGWSGNKYSLESEYPKRTYDLEIVDFGELATKENMWAYFDATIKGSLTENILTAMDVVPTVDIPVLLKVVKKNAAE